jgi:hypothetical protein
VAFDGYAEKGTPARRKRLAAPRPAATGFRLDAGRFPSCAARVRNFALHAGYFRGVRGIVEREDVRLVQPQRERSEDAREGGVIGKRGIAKVFHPVEIVIERVVDAVIAAETRRRSMGIPA